MIIEIVDLPKYKMVIVHSYVSLPEGISVWLVVYLPPWKMMEFVSWDDYSRYMESHKIHVPNHQPDIDCVYPLVN